MFFNSHGLKSEKANRKLCLQYSILNKLSLYHLCSVEFFHHSQHDTNMFYCICHYNFISSMGMCSEGLFLAFCRQKQKILFILGIYLKEQILNYFMYKQARQQSQVVDQNYANGTLFMTLSTLEALEQSVRNQKMQERKRPKQFGAYDRYDYSKKTEVELMMQLITQIMLLNASKADMLRSYGSYNLPQNYDLSKARSRLEQFKSFFSNMNKGKISSLADDCLKILDGKSNLKHPQIYQQLKEFSKGGGKIGSNFTQNLVNEGEHMHSQRKKIEERGDKYGVQDLRFHNNHQYKPKQYQTQQIQGRNERRGQSVNHQINRHQENQTNRYQERGSQSIKKPSNYSSSSGYSGYGSRLY